MFHDGNTEKRPGSLLLRGEPGAAGAAYGTPFVYRFSFGRAPDTGFYGSIGLGLGYAKGVGLTFPDYCRLHLSALVGLILLGISRFALSNHKATFIRGW